TGAVLLLKFMLVPAWRRSVFFVGRAVLFTQQAQIGVVVFQERARGEERIVLAAETEPGVPLLFHCLGRDAQGLELAGPGLPVYGGVFAGLAQLSSVLGGKRHAH